MHALEIIGWVGFVSAVCLIALKFAQQRSWKKATGIVVSLGQKRPGESPAQPIESMYSPVVRFTTEERKEVCEEVRDFQLGPCTVGDVVAVLYDPTTPTHFCSVSLFRRYRIEAGIAFVALIFVLVARS